MTDRHEGGCLCGAVRYVAVGTLRPVVYCHCTQCRRQSGHFYAATDVDDAGLSVSGDENITWYRASDMASRGFCATCGSVLFWKGDGSSRTSVMAGGLDGPTGLKAAAHIFVADKGDYYTLEDGLPQHPAAPG